MDLDTLDRTALAALLRWQMELGATEAIGDAPVNRYELPRAAPKPQAAVAAPDAAAKPAPAAPATSAAPVAPAPVVTAEDPVAAARAAAQAAEDLAALHAAIAAYDYCDLKRGARSTVFADGNPQARVMIIGEAPGRDEDRQGRPFVGRAGQFLDRMLAAIGMSRDGPDADAAAYITNVMPWRPPQNRAPTAEEIGMMMPFVARHVDLVAPEVIVPMGNVSCQALLGRTGITGLRGKWTEVLGRPALPMFHPAYLLRSPHAKRDAWHDLLLLQARLREGVKR